MTTNSTNESTEQPRVGDDWEFKLPGKRKRTKTVGKVDRHPPYQPDVDRPYVHWQRENKGRYTGISVERLMQFGRRVSTKAERDAHLESQIAKAKAKREVEKCEREAMSPSQQTNQKP